MVMSGLLAAFLAVVPMASAGTAESTTDDTGWYRCVATGGGNYACQGVFVDTCGSVCVVHWSDDDSNDDYEDDGASVSYEECAGITCGALEGARDA